jgi:hypothetical protein
MLIKGQSEVSKAGHGFIVGSLIQPPAAIFGKIQFSVNAEFMTTLMVVGHPLVATTAALASLNEEVFVKFLR